MESNLTIEELVKKILSELERVGYSYCYLCGFKTFCKKLIAFALSKNEKYFSIAFGADFLKEKCDLPNKYSHREDANQTKKLHSKNKNS